MAFDSRDFSSQPGEIIVEDGYRRVEMAVAFRKLSCSRCGFTSIYRYQVQQLRRKPEIDPEEGQEIREDQRHIWDSIPRFAEIAETVKCKRCREVLGIYTHCIY